MFVEMFDVVFVDALLVSDRGAVIASLSPTATHWLGSVSHPILNAATAINSAIIFQHLILLSYYSEFLTTPDNVYHNTIIHATENLFFLLPLAHCSSTGLTPEQP